MAQRTSSVAALAATLIFAASIAHGAISIRSDYPGGNVKVERIGEAANVVVVSPDLRDTKGNWFHWDFTLSGAMGRTLHFQFPNNKFDYLSSLGPAISRDGGKTWRWLNADGRRHEPNNAFAYTFGADEDETRFAVSIPYTQADWDKAAERWRGKDGVEFGVLCKSQSGKRDTEMLRIPCRKGEAKWLFVFTARHHACETTANPVMEGVVDEILSDSSEGNLIRDNADCVFVPFMDKDGVEEGDQGKNRKPHDHNRDYVAERYTSVRALKELIVRESHGKKIVFFDLHSPHIRSNKHDPEQDCAFTFASPSPIHNARINTFRQNWAEAAKGGALAYDGKNDIKLGKDYAVKMEKDRKAGRMTSRQWVESLPNCWMSACCEFGYSLCNGIYSQDGGRELGQNLLKAAVRTAMCGGAKDGSAPSGIVSFKDAAKIKSWDAWDDHKKPEPPKEKPCVTWKKLNGLNPGLQEIGRLAVRGAKDVKSSKWSVGCECMDRDYADWNAFKHLLEPLGAKHGRLLSGWAKTEQEKGVYDFTWLDPQVREMAAMGVKPWICLSYGNPVWGSDFRLGMRVKQVTGNPEAFEAWLRYVAACVERYKDFVDEWEIWNEPFHQGPEYAEMFYRTAKAIRAVQPSAKCFCTAIAFPKDYKCVLEKLKRENALDLGSYFIYHPYDPNPDTSYGRTAEPLRKLVKSYSPAFDVMQGETGCPSQLEFAHAMHSIEWTEYAQAKWNLRRAIGDAARSIPSSVFTMIDLQYTFMLQSFGLVRSNTLKEYVYRRPSYFAMQNIYALFDDETLPQKHVVVKIGGRNVSCNLFSRDGRSLRAYWFCDRMPDAGLSFSRVNLEIPEVVENPVWVEMITGRVFEIPDRAIDKRPDGMTLKDVPMWDSPVIIAPRAALPLR